MTNCPNALPGANTSLGMTGDGVDVTITSQVPDTQTEIQKLAAKHSELGPPGGAMMHSGQHGGSGMTGHCPILHHDTIVTSTGETSCPWPSLARARLAASCLPPTASS